MQATCGRRPPVRLPQIRVVHADRVRV